MQFSKFTTNSPENNVHAKQVSIPSFLGILGDKKRCPFSDLGVQSPIFWHPKTANLNDFGPKKIGLLMPKFEI